MHANYVFKLQVSGEKDEELIESARTQFFDWLEEQGDENNWAMPLALILKDGRMFQMAETDDWRGRDKFLEYAEKEWPVPAERYEKARRMALDCVLNDLGDAFSLRQIVFGEPTQSEKEAQEELDRLSFGDLLAKIDEVVPQHLANEYQKIVGRPRPPLIGSDLSDWRRGRLVKTFELLRNASDQPFVAAYEGNPYDYRAFDLTDIKGGEIDAILIADIHT